VTELDQHTSLPYRTVNYSCKKFKVKATALPPNLNILFVLLVESVIFLK